jgi:hypothetical protein
MPVGLHAFFVMMTRSFGLVFVFLLVYYPLGEGLWAGAATVVACIAWYTAFTMREACKTCGDVVSITYS